jgi:hypothetical protein
VIELAVSRAVTVACAVITEPVDVDPNKNLAPSTVLLAYRSQVTVKVCEAAVNPESGTTITILALVASATAPGVYIKCDVPALVSEVEPRYSEPVVTEL